MQPIKKHEEVDNINDFEKAINLILNNQLESTTAAIKTKKLLPIIKNNKNIDQEYINNLLADIKENKNILYLNNLENEILYITFWKSEYTNKIIFEW